MKKVGTYRTLALAKTVVIADPSEVGNGMGADHEGYHVPELGLVVINRTHVYEASRVRDTICHEVVHDWLEASGVQKLLQDKLGLSDGRYEEFEEEIALKLGPALSTSIASLHALVGSVEQPGAAIVRAVRKWRSK